MNTTDEGLVELSLNAGVAEICFSHPKANSLPRPLLSELARTFSEVSAKSDVAVVLLRSAGSGSFCAGASFDEFKKVTSAEAGEAFFMGFAEVLLAMRESRQLIVCAVQGAAVGGGLGLVAASDYVLASSQARVRLSEFELGIGPFTIGPAVERKIGKARFSELSLDCQWRDSQWALECGLFSQLHDSYENVITTARSVSLSFAKQAAASYEMKQMLWAGTENWGKLLPERAKISGTLLAQVRSKQPAP